LAGGKGRPCIRAASGAREVSWGPSLRGRQWQCVAVGAAAWGSNGTRGCPSTQKVLTLESTIEWLADMKAAFARRCWSLPWVLEKRAQLL